MSICPGQKTNITLDQFSALREERPEQDEQGRGLPGLRCAADSGLAVWSYWKEASTNRVMGRGRPR
jgi:hypothetical protein